MLEVTGSILVGTFDSMNTGWTVDQNETQADFQVTISELEFVFNPVQTSYIDQSCINDEENKMIDNIVSTQPNDTSIHMHGLFTLDTFNRTTLVMRDCRFNTPHDLDSKTCCFMAVELCTDSKLIAELSRLTDQPGLEFRSKYNYDPMLDNDDINTCYCKEGVRIVLSSCMFKKYHTLFDISTNSKLKLET